MFLPHCLFCNMLKNKESTPSYVITLNSGSLFINNNQYYSGRLIYLYKEHLIDISKLNEIDLLSVMKDIKYCFMILKRNFNPDAIDIATSNNFIPHLHWHIIPKYSFQRDYFSPPYGPNENKIITKSEMECLVLKYQQLFYDDPNI